MRFRRVDTRDRLSDATGFTDYVHVCLAREFRPHPPGAEHCMIVDKKYAVRGAAQAKSLGLFLGVVDTVSSLVPL